MAPGKDRRIATVSRLRPSSSKACVPRRLEAVRSTRSNVIDLAGARARRRAPGQLYTPPEGTAA